VEAALAADGGGGSVRAKNAISVPEAIHALRQAQVFLSDVAGPPDTDEDQRRLTSTLHALDHASRLAETAGGIDIGTVRSGSDDARAGELCANAMRIAIAVATDVAVPSDIEQSPSGAKALSTDEALVQLACCATALEELQRKHRAATLGAVAEGTLNADAAIIRVDTVRTLQTLARHAWRSTVHLAGRDT
jgi:phosphate:Na+ symporter